MILKGYIFAVIYGILCLLLAHVMYKFGVPKIFTRKTVHILIGFEWIILYHFHGPSYHFVIVCLMFLALITVSHYKRAMPMISSESSNSLGTVYYCLSMTVMAIVSVLYKSAIIPFGIAVFCTSFGDGFAGIVGQSMKRYNPKLYSEKTLWGALTNFLLSLASAFVFSQIFKLNGGFWFALAVAAMSVVSELLVERGVDNITLPLSVFALSLFLLNAENPYNYVLPIILTPLIIAIALKKKWLTLGGVLCAVVLDVAVSAAFGNFGFIYILIFLIGGTLLDKVKKSTTHENFERKPRSLFQVLANSLAAIICSILFCISKNEVFFLAFCASIAEAFSDTVASSVGSLSKNTYDIFKFKKCRNGLSGGVSLIGTLGAFTASLLMAVIVFLLTPISAMYAMLVLLVSFVGVFIDTFLGSVVQAKYFCEKCEKLSEEKLCCGTNTKRISGAAFFTNELVNLFSSAFSSILAVVAYILIK